jgi:cytosine/adenosine deaminase-related metal-dependent hydrolase
VRKISATYIFPGNKPPLKNGILVCDDDGKILELTDTKGKIEEEAGLEYYSGILVPGFINAHCHLELSHLMGKIPEKEGLGEFIGNINKLRNLAVEDVIESSIRKADKLLFAGGIVAVGDISNSILSLKIKSKSKIYYRTFIEAFGFHPSRAEQAFDFACFTENIFHENQLAASVVPHSAYSVSESLFKKITNKAVTQQSLLSIHNQESEAEQQFFKEGTGPIAHHLQNNLGLDISHWQPTGENSLIATLNYLPEENQLLLVHNTFTNERDIEKLKSGRNPGNTFLVLCPNSNLYIENKLPDVPLFRKHQLNICLGTDSLASNHKLSVLNEMITLEQHFPEVSLEELIKWATLNGARALQIEDRFGSFETGKNPRVNLITGADLKSLKLTSKCKVKKLV